MDEFFVIWMMMEEEEEERKKKEEKKRREEEERQRVIRHRKTSPVIWNREDWQINRCIKAFSLQPCVQNFVQEIFNIQPSVVKNEEKRYDNLLIEQGFEYEQSRKELDNDIKKLKELGITVDGKQNELVRLASTNSHIAKVEQSTESFGNTFTIMNGQPIILNPDILSSERYYEDKYEKMNPNSVEVALEKNNSKINRYKKIGSHLKFLLNSRLYLNLEENKEDLIKEKEKCEVVRKEMESYNSLNKEQLIIIKSYFIHLDQLSKISQNIKDLFSGKEYLRYKYNKNIIDLCIKEIIATDNYQELVLEVSDYLSRLYANDKETMEDAYKLVEGEYPIEIEDRFIYDLIIENMNDYKKEGTKQYSK